MERRWPNVKIGIPMLTGPVFGFSKRMDVQAPEGLADQFSNIYNREHPGFGITLITFLMPVLLMLIGAFSAVFDEDSILDDGIAFVGKLIIRPHGFCGCFILYIRLS